MDRLLFSKLFFRGSINEVLNSGVIEIKVEKIGFGENIKWLMKLAE